MKLSSLKRFRTPTYRLATTYLAIIMLMSIGFSIVFYNTSSHELGRQLPPNSLFDNQTAGQYGTDEQNHTQPPQLNRFLQQRIREGRSELFTRLLILNFLAVAGGSAVSYYLARRNLQPLEQAMEAQAQFVSDASHELRTPLTAIQTVNEVSLRNSKLTLAQAKAVIRGNTAEASKLKDLSDGLLDLAKQDKIKLDRRPLSLSSIVTEALNQIIPAATSKAITVEDAVDDLKVVANEQALVRLLVIILDNAIKYSHADSTVWLSAKAHSKQAVIEIRDQGIGIRASDLPHIFRRFYRADTARSSTAAQTGYGLGLPIAHKLVEQLQGTIDVQSEPGVGTTFTIKIPLA